MRHRKECNAASNPIRESDSIHDWRQHPHMPGCYDYVVSRASASMFFHFEEGEDVQGIHISL